MKNVLLIYNPVSGKQTIQYSLPIIQEELINANCLLDTISTEYKGHANELSYKAKSDGYDTIICCGGDGTLNECLSGIMQSNSNKVINLGYIPCGSTNDFGETLGLSQNPKTQVLRIVNGNISNLDVGLFNNNRYFSYIASFGALTKASYDTPQEAKNILGHFAYIIDGIKEMSNIKPIKARVIADGHKYSGEYIFGSVSNTKSVGGIVKLKDSDVDLHDGLFEVLLVKFPNDLIAFNEIIAGASFSDFDCDMFELIKAKEISFDFEEKIPWSLDGEKEDGSEKVKISIKNDAIKLLV